VEERRGEEVEVEEKVEESAGRKPTTSTLTVGKYNLLLKALSKFSFNLPN